MPASRGTRRERPGRQEPKTVRSDHSSAARAEYNRRQRRNAVGRPALSPSITLAAGLFFAGLFLLSLELFVPSGMLMLASLSCMLASVYVGFLVHWVAGVVMLGLLLTALVLLPTVGLRVWRRSPVGKHLFLEPPAEVSAKESATPYEHLVGEVGKTLSPLRPSGSVEVGGVRISGVSQGMMVGAGELVRVVAVEGNRVVVRRLAARERAAFEGGLIDIPDLDADRPPGTET